jgi:hypothetical protein
MEAAPVRWRGILSGILQSGYSIGYLLAALAALLWFGSEEHGRSFLRGDKATETST